MKCGWDDHKMYAHNTCPIHPSYDGVKPKVRGDHADALAWKREQQRAAELKTRRQAALEQRRTIPCRRGCGKSFCTTDQRKVHEKSFELDGTTVIFECTVPGCKFRTGDGPGWGKHVDGCWQTFAYKSPVCMACGICFENREINVEARRMELTGTRARAYWQRHVNLYKQSRQVDCRSCGAPHLMPWCATTPKTMGRHFRCSDNYFDLQMGSAQCRQVRPAGPPPPWVTAADESAGGSSEDAAQDVANRESADGEDDADEEAGDDIYNVTTDDTGSEGGEQQALQDAGARVDHPQINALAAAPGTVAGALPGMIQL